MWAVGGILKVVVFTAIGRGILAALAAKGIRPDQWVSRMILAAEPVKASWQPQYDGLALAFLVFCASSSGIQHISMNG
jgi:hypothetical protein